MRVLKRLLENMLHHFLLSFSTLAPFHPCQLESGPNQQKPKAVTVLALHFAQQIRAEDSRPSSYHALRVRVFPHAESVRTTLGKYGFVVRLIVW